MPSQKVLSDAIYRSRFTNNIMPKNL